MKLHCRGIAIGGQTDRRRHVGMKNCRVASSHVELLEQRCLLSTFTVTNNADSGAGSLRQSILNANANKGADTIDFNIKVGAISEVAVPNSGPQGITTGPDGNLWFTEANTNQIGRITPSGVITQFPIPTPNSDPVGITAGPDGNLWFTEESANQIGRITPTGAITEFAIATPNSDPVGITAGPDGNLWFTENNITTSDFLSRIGRITPTGLITEFLVPTPDSGPLGITAGPDGNLWFTEETANQIGRITTAGAVTEFAVPTPNSQPEDIIAGPGGNLWFTEFSGNQIGTINPTTHAITELPIPTAGSVPIGITAAADGNLWFAESVGNQIGRLDPTTDALTEFSVPTSNSYPFGITAGPDGNLWFTEQDANQIGRLTLANSGLTITPTTALPAITGPVTIDGTTQPGFAGSPIIEIDGASAGTGVNGLTIAADGRGSTVRGLVINRFNGNGIESLTNDNAIEGNFIGTDVTGKVALGNGMAGVILAGTSNTVANNVISGNAREGIFDSAGGNTIRENLIGTDAAGTSPLGNGLSGITLQGSSNDTIRGNVISDNGRSRSGGSGIILALSGTQPHGNLIQGNLIGTNAAGTEALPNVDDGLDISGLDNTVGGTAGGAGNVISGNRSNGIRIFAGTPGGNQIMDNLIGTNASGTAALGNGTDGILLGAAGNTIGGNVISGNGSGLVLMESGTQGNLVQRNFIGTNAAGIEALPNLGDGLTISGLNNTIGGTAPGNGNVISGNGGNGVSLTGTSNAVTGNLIGVNVNGDAPLGNTSDGILLTGASSNSITGNVISANGIGQSAAGIDLTANSSNTAFSSNNTIADNMIGTNSGGTAGLGNSLAGILVGDGSSGNTLGPKNVISGNGAGSNSGIGVYVFGDTSSGNIILRNSIGTSSDGTRAIGGSVIGVLINAAPGNLVQSNVISGNQVIGVEIAGATASSNIVQSNLIGTNQSGTAAIPNGADGIFVNNAPGNTIGGQASADGNVVSGNGQLGIQIFGLGARRNLIENNTLGRNISGGVGRGLLNGNSGDLGIYVNTTPNANTIVGNIGQGRGKARQAHHSTRVTPVRRMVQPRVLGEPSNTLGRLPIVHSRPQRADRHPRLALPRMA